MRSRVRVYFWSDALQWSLKKTQRKIKQNHNFSLVLKQTKKKIRVEEVKTNSDWRLNFYFCVVFNKKLCRVNWKATNKHSVALKYWARNKRRNKKGKKNKILSWVNRNLKRLHWKYIHECICVWIWSDSKQANRNKSVNLEVITVLLWSFIQPTNFV